MKRIRVMTLIMLVILLIGITNVFAAQASITLQGEDTVEPGETKSVTVKVSSEKGVAGLQGKIKSEGNINIIGIEGMSGWTATKIDDGFLAYTNDGKGHKNEAVMKINYTAKSEEGTGKIIISEILASITVDEEELEEETISDATKVITVKNEGTGDSGAGDSGVGDSGVGDSGAGDSGAGNSGGTGSNSDKKDPTTSKREHEDAGLESAILPMSIITVLSIVSYVRYRKYKNI